MNTCISNYCYLLFNVFIKYIYHFCLVITMRTRIIYVFIIDWIWSINLMDLSCSAFSLKSASLRHKRLCNSAFLLPHRKPFSGENVLGQTLLNPHQLRRQCTRNADSATSVVIYSTSGKLHDTLDEIRRSRYLLSSQIQKHPTTVLLTEKRMKLLTLLTSINSIISITILQFSGTPTRTSVTCYTFPDTLSLCFSLSVSPSLSKY